MQETRLFALINRHQKISLVFGYLFLSVLFFLPVSKDFTKFVTPQFLDTGHIIFFACFSFSFAKFLGGAFRLRVVKALAITITLSFLIEGTQNLVGRSFELTDIYRNILGAMLGLSLYFLIARTSRYQAVLAAALLFCVCGAIAVERGDFIDKSIGALIATEKDTTTARL